MANVNNSMELADLITERLKEISRKEVTENQKKEITRFKGVCQAYINSLDGLILKINQRLSLVSRIQLLGQIMHQDFVTLPQLLQLNNLFQDQLNNYLGRENYLTWISTAASSIGEIRIADYNTEMQIFGQYSGIAKDGIRGKISGINLDTFKNVYLNEEMTALQEEINNRTAKRGQVFGEALYRYNKTLTSTQENMSEKTKQQRARNMNFVVQNKGESSSIYWRITTDGKKLNWQRVSNRGFIGQAYVMLILNHPYSGGTITYRHGNGPNPPPYNLNIHQEQIRLLASYVKYGDSIPGAIQGDIQWGENGKIHLAVKQGPSFHTGSMAIDVAIAYAFLQENIEDRMLLSETINKSLEQMSEKCKNDTTHWEKVFQLLAGISDDSVLRNALQGMELRTNISL